MRQRPKKSRGMMQAQLPEKELYNLETALSSMEKDTDPIFEKLPNFPTKEIKQMHKSLL
jgi:hypothetical protein